MSPLLDITSILPCQLPPVPLFFVHPLQLFWKEGHHLNHHHGEVVVSLAMRLMQLASSIRPPLLQKNENAAHSRVTWNTFWCYW